LHFVLALRFCTLAQGRAKAPAKARGYAGLRSIYPNHRLFCWLSENTLSFFNLPIDRSDYDLYNISIF
jgi:hypothetical protein